MRSTPDSLALHQSLANASEMPVPCLPEHSPCSHSIPFGPARSFHPRTINSLVTLATFLLSPPKPWIHDDHSPLPLRQHRLHMDSGQRPATLFSVSRPAVHRAVSSSRAACGGLEGSARDTIRWGRLPGDRSRGMRRLRVGTWLVVGVRSCNAGDGIGDTATA